MTWVLIFIVVFALLIDLCAWLASKSPRPSLTVPFEIRQMHARQQREEQERAFQRERETRLAEAEIAGRAMATALRDTSLRFEEIIHSDTERTLICNQMEPGQVVSISEDGRTTHVQGPNTRRTGNSQGVAINSGIIAGPPGGIYTDPEPEVQQVRRFRDE